MAFVDLEKAFDCVPSHFSYLVVLLLLPRTLRTICDYMGEVLLYKLSLIEFRKGSAQLEITISLITNMDEYHQGRCTP